MSIDTHRGLDPDHPYFLVKAYLRDIKNLPTLTPEQERELARTIRESRMRMKAVLARIPWSAEFALARWHEILDEGRTPATLSAHHREPGHGDCAKQVSRGLARVEKHLARLHELGREAERAPVRVSLTDALEKTELSFALFTEIHTALRERFAQADSERALARDLGLPVAALREVRSELAAAFDAFDEAKGTFVRHNLKLVVSMAKQYRSFGMPFMDLIQEGNLGLVRAVEKFDERLGFRFSTYGAWWIHQAFIRSVQNHSRTIRLPSHVYDLGVSVKRSEEKLRRRLGRDPKPEELARDLDVETETIEQYQRATRQPVSLEKEVVGLEGRALHDQIADPAVTRPVDFLTEARMVPEVSSLLEVLNERERTILALRFGLGDREPHTLQEIGSALGLSRERVRQVEGKALNKLREGAETRGMRSHLESDLAAELIQGSVAS